MHMAQRTVVGLEVAAALAQLATARPSRPTPLAELAATTGVEATFVHHVLRHLRIAGLVTSKRGAEGGWSLSRPPEAIDASEVVVALDGPLLGGAGEVPSVAVGGGADRLLVALRHTVRDVLESVTVADLARGTLPAALGDAGAPPAAAAAS
jgi:Rrf2 family protein